jgi:predicted PurR-regulated permease PerM
VLLSFVLSPIVRGLAQTGLPEPVGVALLALLLVVALAAAVYGLAEPVAAWLATLPGMLYRLRFRIESLVRPLAEVTQATAEALGGGGEGDQASAAGLGAGAALDGARFLLAAGITLVVTLYLLAFGRNFGHAALRLIPAWGSRRRALRIGRAVQREVSRYLLTITLINAGLAVAVAVVLWLLGMPNPILFGILAGLFNFVPFIGPTIHVGLVFLVGLASFPFPGEAFLPPLAVLALNVIESQVVTPNLLARRLTLNPILVILAIILWGWLWGIAGALIAVPLLAAIKITCDHIPRLAPVGAFIGTQRPT